MDRPLTAEELDDLGLARRLVADGSARGLREQAQIRQAEIGRLLLVSRSLPAHWEAGRKAPSGLIGARYGALLRHWLGQS